MKFPINLKFPINFGKTQLLIGAGAGLVIAGTYIWKNWDKLQAKELESFVVEFNEISKNEKTALFQVLNEKAKEAGPKNYKVLEIGGGTGANFEFITGKSQFSSPVLYLSLYFNQQLFEN